MNRLICFILSALALSFLGGCSTYVDGYYFTPSPAVAQVFPPATTQPAQPPMPAVEALVSVIGIHREDKKEGIPTSIQIRMRIENNGPEPVTFDPRSMELYDASALKFPPPLVGQPHAYTLAATQSLDLEAFFPFPLGHSWDNTDLRALRLRWIVQIHDQNVEQAVEFRRVYRAYYYDPYWDYPPPPFYGGFVGGVVVHVRR